VSFHIRQAVLNWMMIHCMINRVFVRATSLQ
jgi:hypothetical protein